MRDIVVGQSWRDRLEDLIGTRRHAVALAALVVALLAITSLTSRGGSARVAPPARAATAPPATASPGSVLVHVAGAVAVPGLYRLPVGARVADAIHAAGGARRHADLDALNLAQPLTDGQQVLVPSGRGQAVADPPAVGETAPPPVNLNTADQSALETIPGVGPVTALAILDFRSQVGGFRSLEQLLEISGIGPATLESMRPYVTL